MDWKSSAGMFKTDHLAVGWHHSESPSHGRFTVGRLAGRASRTLLLNIRSEFEKWKPSGTLLLTKPGDSPAKGRKLARNGEQSPTEGPRAILRAHGLRELPGGTCWNYWA